MTHHHSAPSFCLILFIYSVGTWEVIELSIQSLVTLSDIYHIFVCQNRTMWWERLITFLQEMRICVLPWKLGDTYWIELMFVSEHSFIFVFKMFFKLVLVKKMNPTSSILLDHEKSENNFSLCFHVKMRKLVSTLCQRNN